MKIDREKKAKMYWAHSASNIAQLSLKREKSIELGVQ